MIILILFIAFLLGLPIAFALGIVSLGQIASDGYPLSVVLQRMFTGVDSIALTAIPLFILSGGLMLKGGMSKKIVNFADLLLGHLPSGLAMVSILACMFFAAITGSAIAAAAAIGSIMIPIMIEKGYDKEFCAPLIATGGSIGPIIPPSIPLLIYGVMANASVAKLFIGGIVPGILMGFGLMGYSYVVGKKRNYIGRSERAPTKEILLAARDAVLALIMPFIIIGGILSGVFSPTESATVATFYALFIGMFVYKELKLSHIPNLLLDAARATAQVLLVVAFASVFTWVITVNNIPQFVGEFLTTNIGSMFLLLLVINIVLLIAGTFIDTTSAIVIFTPIFLPLALAFGIDPIHFGVVMVVNLAIGMCTPPLGVCLFVTGSIAKVSIKDQMKDLSPMLLVLLVVLLIVTYIPQTVLFLPSLFD